MIGFNTLDDVRLSDIVVVNGVRLGMQYLAKKSKPFMRWGDQVP